MFYYLIDLHYSQTARMQTAEKALFYYLIDLHYSQTNDDFNYHTEMFYYLIDLHYSQTAVTELYLFVGFTTL